MPDLFSIVIADRNPHVRRFLQRELSREGYRIHVAESAQALLQRAFARDPVDLIILDPDLPDAADARLLQTLEGRMPEVPVVIHTHYAHAFRDKGCAFVMVEKGGSSVERLKQIAATLLSK